MLEVRRIKLETSAGAVLEVSHLKGREAISELFEFEILATYRGGDGLDGEDLIGQDACVVFDRDGTETRRIHGMISVVNDRLETEADYSSYRLAFVPRAYKLTLVETLDVFLDLSVPDLLRLKLTGAAMKEGEDFDLRLFETYPVRDLIVQYKETDLQFISRLCEHLGISYFFEHATGRDVLVFTDMTTGFRPNEGAESEPYRPRGEKRHVHRLEETLRMIPADYVVRDYNYRTPQVSLTGHAEVPAGVGSVVEYGAHVKTPEEADQLAQVRAEERLSARRVFDGASDVEALRHGARIVIEDHPMGDLRLLLVEVRHSLVQAVYGAGAPEGGPPSYENEFKAVHEKLRYRPARVTPKPRIHGVVTAVIDAENKGQYAEIDEQGRYRVKFLFDTTGPGQAQASRLVRMAQPHSGAGYGMHFPLRPGVEVLLTFIDGDPDRPIISATVPNPQTASPVARENAPRNIIRTGGGNEINIDDTEDEQRIKFHSPHSSTTFQLGSPNAPERGAVLETWGADTALAVSGSATLASSNTALTLAQTTLAAGNIVVNAGGPETDGFEKFLLFLNLFTGAAGALTDTALSIVAIMQKEEDAELAHVKEAQTKAQEDLDNYYYASDVYQRATDKALGLAAAKKEVGDNVKKYDSVRRLAALEGEVSADTAAAQKSAVEVDAALTKAKAELATLDLVDPSGTNAARKREAVAALEAQKAGLADQSKYSGFPAVAGAQKALGAAQKGIAEKRGKLANPMLTAAERATLEAEVAALEAERATKQAALDAQVQAVPELSGPAGVLKSATATQAEKDAAQKQLDATLRLGAEGLGAQKDLDSPTSTQAQRDAARAKLATPELRAAQSALTSAEAALARETAGTPGYEAAKLRKEEAEKQLKSKTDELARAEKDAGGKQGTVTPTLNDLKNNEGVKRQRALDAAKAEYDRAKWDFDNGEYTRNLKEAKVRLDQIKGATDYAKQTLALYSTLTKIIALLGESKGIKKIKKAWNKTHDLVEKSAAQVVTPGDVYTDALNPAPKRNDLTKLAPKLTNLQKLGLLFAAPLAGPVASVPAVFAAFAVMFAKDTPDAGHVSADQPYPIYNIQSSKGTAALYADGMALVSGRVAVLLARKPEPGIPPALSDTPSLNDGSVIITGEAAALLTSPDTTEVAGNQKMYVTSDKLVGIKSREKIDVFAGTTTNVLSKEKIDVEAESQNITITANKAADQEIRIAAKKTISGVSEDAITLKAAKTAELLAGAGASPGWGLKVDGTAGSVKLGHVTGAWNLEIKDGHARLGGSGSGVAAKNEWAKLHTGMSMVEVKQSAIQVKGTASVDLVAPVIRANGKVLLG